MPSVNIMYFALFKFWICESNWNPKDVASMDLTCAKQFKAKMQITWFLVKCTFMWTLCTCIANWLGSQLITFFYIAQLIYVLGLHPYELLDITIKIQSNKVDNKNLIKKKNKFYENVHFDYITRIPLK